MTPEWRRVTLSSVTERLTGRNTVGETNVLTISGRHGLVSQREYFNKQVASENLAHYFLLQQGDFAYNKSHSDGYPVGAIKRLVRYDRGVVSPLYICFRLRPSVGVCAEFLAHYFEAGRLERDLRAIAKEGARNHGLLNVKPGEFFDLSLLLPRLPEQKKIAAILSSVDDAIEATQAVIDQLQVVKKSMLAELLTRGLPGRHSRFKMTEIGVMPEEWEIAPLENWLAKLIDYRGKSPPKHHTGVPLITAKNVRLAFIDPEPREYIAATSYSEWMTRGVPKPGDVLFTTEAPLGNAAPVPAEQIALGQRLITLCPDRRRVDPAFFLWAILGPGFQSELLARATGSTVKGIKQSVLRTIPLAMPPLEEQRTIGRMLGSVASRLMAESDSVESLRATKTALMSVLLTGEVRVTPDEDAA